MTLHTTPKPFPSLNWSAYDFIDLGSSRGGSLKYCSARFKARCGVGIDLDAAKMTERQPGNHIIVHADARSLSLRKVVRFVSAMDFFEHLPTLKDVEHVLGAAAAAATDFLFISHPSFEGEHYLRQVGLRQYWHDWTGHQSHIHVSEYCNILARLGLHQYALCYHERIDHSSHESIVPLSAPKDGGRYDATVHGRKPQLRLACPVWRSQRIYVALRAIPPDEWATVVNGQ